MAKIPFEFRRLKTSPNLAPHQREFAVVEIDAQTPQTMLLLTFGSILYEMDVPLARDFCDRVARAASTRIAKGSRRSYHCRPGIVGEDRAFVEVLAQDDGERTWLRLEFHDGNTVDFSTIVGRDFAARIARADKYLADA